MFNVLLLQYNYNTILILNLNNFISNGRCFSYLVTTLSYKQLNAIRIKKHSVDAIQARNVKKFLLCLLLT